jgi:probable rRNA maturation factor
MSKSENRYRVSIRQDLRPAPLSGKKLKKLVVAALELLRTSKVDLRIRIAGNAAITRLNREFFGKNRPTNVISFPDEDSLPKAEKVMSGDIIVSAPTCLAQTEKWKDPHEERVFFFILHGMLHLAGYDHVNGEAQRSRMRKKELDLFRQVTQSLQKCDISTQK